MPIAFTDPVIFDPLNGGLVPSDILCWLEADKLGLANNAEVTAWADVSPSALSATKQSTTGPAFKTGIFGSQPAVYFDGTNTLRITTLDLSAISALEVLVLGKQDTTTNLVMVEHGTSNNAEISIQAGAGTGNLQINWKDGGGGGGNAQSFVTLAATQPMPFIVGLRADRARPAPEIVVDALQHSIWYTMGGSETINSTGTCASAPLWIGGRSGNTFMWVGHIALIAVLKKQTITKRGQLLDWLTTKYGLTAF